MKWLNVLENDPDKLDLFLDEYNKHLDDAKLELEISENLIKEGQRLPHIVDFRFSQLQEVDAVYELFDIKTKEVKSKFHRYYLTNYNQKLVSRDVERFVEGEPEYIEILIKRNKLNLLRNKFSSITKALEYKHFQLTNIVKLKVAGIDEFT